MDSTNTHIETDDATQTNMKFYRAAWRWHFYAGLYVIPFLIMLAVTGLAMMWIAFIDGRDGEKKYVTPLETPLTVTEQAQAASDAFTNGTIAQYIAPRADDMAAIFRVNTAEGPMMAVVDPYTAEVLETFSRRSGLYDLMDNIHGTLLIGVVGDRMIEIAASLSFILIATGTYLWWPRKSYANAEPSNAKPSPRKRLWWKNWHNTIGIWSAALLAFFLVSGLAWAGIWGEKFVQAWSTFPAEKWGAPLSEVPHSEMNSDIKEVPWGLEQTLMPISGTEFGEDGLADGVPVNLNTIDALARAIGFQGRYQMNLPMGETGVFTLSRDSMSTDTINPMSDRTVHIDRYSGKILADVKYEDYSLMAKFMAVGIALHMGTAGLAVILINTVFCLSVIFLCISGTVMWFKRRPANSGLRILPPPLPRDMLMWKGAIIIAALLSIAFPMAGITLLAVLILDWIILQNIPALRKAML